MTREMYHRWAEAQPHGRFELVAGEVVAMAPERVGHAETKAMAWLLLRQAIAAAGLSCQALPDRVTVVMDDATVYEPGALVNCGERPDRYRRAQSGDRGGGGVAGHARGG
ncbi:Uma2 family endonuclease [Siccirubricoccus sp. G192]|nr:Uma2 family endonuclease [Siccirubricoccus sp. G192]